MVGSPPLTGVLIELFLTPVWTPVISSSESPPPLWPTGAADQWGSLWPGPGGGQWGRCSGGGRSLSDALLPELQERGWGQSHLHETDRGLREEKRGLPDRRGTYDLWPHCLNPCSSLWLQWHFKSDAASCFGHLGATETSCGQFLIKMTTAALKTITSGLWISCFVLYKVHSIFSGYFSWLDVVVVLRCSTLSTWKRPSGRSKSWRPPGSQWLRLCVSDLMEIWTESAPETVLSDSSTLVRQRLTSLSC